MEPINLTVNEENQAEDHYGHICHLWISCLLIKHPKIPPLWSLTHLFNLASWFITSAFPFLSRLSFVFQFSSFHSIYCISSSSLTVNYNVVFDIWHFLFPILSSVLTHETSALMYDMWKLWHIKTCVPPCLPSSLSYIGSPFISPLSSTIRLYSFQLNLIPLTCMWCHLYSHHIFSCFALLPCFHYSFSIN